MSNDQPQTPSTAVPHAAPSAGGEQQDHVEETDPRILLQRQGERRRETERKLALHIQQYRETHPLARTE